MVKSWVYATWKHRSCTCTCKVSSTGKKQCLRKAMRQLSIHSNACARQCRCTRLVPAQGIRCLQKAMPAQGTYTCMNPTAIHKEPHTRMHQVWLYCKRTCVIPSVVAMGGILYCIVLYCIVLFCIVLYCIVLNGIALYCLVLYCIAMLLISPKVALEIPVVDK